MKLKALQASFSSLRSTQKVSSTPLNRANPLNASKTWSHASALSSSAFLSSNVSSSRSGRKRLVILGTGWGGYSVVTKANKKMYDVIVISPRNHFLFTPLLASTSVGTLEFRSIIEPIRNAGFRDEHHFHLSHAMGLDSEKQIVHCVSALDPSMCYDVPYDVLVIAVGAVSSDFNIPGVKEHAFFLRVCKSQCIDVLCNRWEPLIVIFTHEPYYKAAIIISNYSTVEPLYNGRPLSKLSCCIIVRGVCFIEM